MLDLIRRWLFRRRVSALRRQFKSLGANVQFSSGLDLSCPERIDVGNHVYIGPGALIAADGGLRIGDGVIIGPRVTILTSTHRYEGAEALPYDSVTLLRPVGSEGNVWMWAKVSLVPGVRIGEGAIVAMGAVVTRDVPAGSVVGGNPARVLKQRDMDHYERIKSEGRIYLDLKAKGQVAREDRDEAP